MSAKALLPKDFKDFLEILNANDVEFAVAGAYAMAAWGYVRATGDIDIYVKPSATNAIKLMEALKKFGAPLSEVNHSDFEVEGTVFQMGQAPLRIDILTSLDGVPVTKGINEISKKMETFGIPLPTLLLDVLIQNKRATGRPRDISDAEALANLKRQLKNES